MKFDIHILIYAVLLLVTPMLRGQAARGGVELTVAALALPDESTGLVHWSAADPATTPLQLSTRYFSERVKVSGNVVRFYQEPVTPESAGDGPPEPLAVVRIPADTALAYVILWAAESEGGGTEWKAMLMRGEDWKAGSLKVLNGSASTLGIQAGEKRLQLRNGRHLDFMSSDFRDAFPVKIYRLEPETKLVFSSTWRVAAGRRELCFLTGEGDSISLRSLMDLAAPPREAQR
jgi:hypothetical protein